MKFNRPVIAAVYALGILMFVIPFTEVLLSVLPLRPGETAWRFGMTGVMSQALMTPLLGATVLVLVAATRGHRRTLLALSIVAAIGSVLTLAASGLFTLDAFQMRAQVRTEVKAAFDLSSIIAILKLLAAAAVFGLLSVGARKSAHELRSGTRPRSTTNPPLVVPSER